MDLQLKKSVNPFLIIENVEASDNMFTFNLEPPVTPIEWRIRTVELPNHSAFQNEIMEYAYKISNNKDFLYTLKMENGTIDPNRKSDIIGKNGHWDYGLCQLNYQWHSEFINSDTFDDWSKQIDYCYNVFKQRPTAFYGYYRRHLARKHFKFN